MSNAPTTAYLRTKVMTASPEMLQLMLWDGAIRFAEQGKDAIIKKDIEGSYKGLMRAQQIIMEMSAGLRREVNPDLCDKLAALYHFMYRRLVDANLQKDPKLVEDALEIMRHQRETWVMLMDRLAQERGQQAPATMAENADASVASAEMEALPQAPRPAARRGVYGGLALKPAPAAATLSVEG